MRLGFRQPSCQTLVPSQPLNSSELKADTLERSDRKIKQKIVGAFYVIHAFFKQYI